MTTKELIIEDGLVAEGFDEVALVNWCSPNIGGFRICISANAEGNSVKMKIDLKTPVGSFSKRFSFSKNVCFTWKPQSWVKLEACITKFKVQPNEICFTLSAKICAAGACSPSFRNEFCMPLPGTIADKLSTGKIDEQALVQHLLLSNLMQGDEQACSCH